MCFWKKKKEKVWVDVCNDWPDYPGSVARQANEWCPGKHSGQYLKTDAPKNICNKHAKPEEPPPPLEVKKCKDPYHLTYKLKCFSGASLVAVCMQDTPHWKKADMSRYLNTLVNHGMNSLRSVSGWIETEKDKSLGWLSYLPYRDAEYYPHIHEILGLIKERELTLILSLMPYDGWYDDATLRRLIQETKIYLPNIIYETANECSDLDKQKRIVAMLLAEGVPEKHIQLNYVDSSDFGYYIQAHKFLSCCHECGSEKTMDIWWKGSPGCNQLMDLKLYPSDDGGDKEHGSLGYKFEHPDSAKPSPPQLYNLCKYFLERTVGFDHLSAAGFQGCATPNMELEMTLGIPEMDHMAQAYKDLFGD